jgi:hypothetical protein
MQNTPGSLPFSRRDLRLGAIQDLLELRNTMSHSGMHISLRTFDVVMKIIPEQLNMGNSSFRSGCVPEMTREENKCDISDVFRVSETRDMTNFERRIPVRI